MAIGRRRLTCALGLLAVLAAACGSSGAAGSGHSAPTASDQRRVAGMVLADGDLHGYAVRGTGAEGLADQLPPRGVRSAGLTARLVRADWLASEHSILVARRGARPPVWSDANLFASAADARRISRLELREQQPRARTRTLAPPAGAPAGAQYARMRKGARAEYELVWQEGPVIGIVVIQVPAAGTARAPGPAAIGAIIARAATAQSVRIGNALRGQKSV